MTSMVLSILAIGIASNLDNGGVGIAYGVRKIRIPFWSNLIIGFISFFATWVAGEFGQLISKFLRPELAGFLGMLVLVLVGVWVLYQPLLKKVRPNSNPLTRILRNPHTEDLIVAKSLGVWQSVILGVALAMNALAGGFDAGIVGLSLIWTSLSVGIFSLLMLGGAAVIGEKYAANRLGDQASLAAGILLILIGIHQFV